MSTGKLDRTSLKTPQDYRMQRLTAKQRAFTAEMMATPTMDPTEAARRAGYKNPKEQACQLLRHPTINQAISASLNQRERRLEKDGDELVRRLWGMLEFDPADIFENVGGDRAITLKQLQDMPKSARQNINSIKVKSRSYIRDDEPVEETEFEIKWPDKLAVGTLLAKHHGIIEPQENTSATVSVNIVSDIREKLERDAQVRIVDDSVIEGEVLKGGRKDGE